MPVYFLKVITENIAERTNGATEAWNLIIKRVDHPQHRMRPDVFLKEHHEVLKGRQMAFTDNLTLKDRKAVEVSIYNYYYILLLTMINDIGED